MKVFAITLIVTALSAIGMAQVGPCLNQYLSTECILTTRISLKSDLEPTLMGELEITVTAREMVYAILRGLEQMVVLRLPVINILARGYSQGSLCSQRTRACTEKAVISLALEQTIA
ncbi:hypothetical protein BOTCAL_1186g00010 [Botryotinia calthae]|uniref:Hydrophobin n=1 Tax=Botryotinia calthae TaxID=38488 RepID=A0A4Y8CFR3_9HELO|nr:hypothetical protein BOTCAL_1186g00010 [Botryotinia calthae]